MSTAGDKLLIGGLTTNPLPNLQRIANKIKLNWQTVAVPYLLPEYSYKGGAFTANYRGYMRGETYPFGIVFEFEDGTNSPVYHIPGRKSTSSDIQLQTGENNKDLIQNDPCVTETFPKWKVYDTATVTDTFTEYDDLVAGDIDDDTLTSNGSYVYKESVSQTFPIQASKLITFNVVQDNSPSTVINASDGKIIQLVGSDFTGTIKFIKGNSGTNNDLTCKLTYYTPDGNKTISGNRQDIENTPFTTLVGLAESETFNLSTNQISTLSITKFEFEITYGTTTTDGSPYGSNYVQFALDKIFTFLSASD